MRELIFASLFMYERVLMLSCVILLVPSAMADWTIFWSQRVFGVNSPTTPTQLSNMSSKWNFISGLIIMSTVSDQTEEANIAQRTLIGSSCDTTLSVKQPVQELPTRMARRSDTSGFCSACYAPYCMNLDCHRSSGQRHFVVPHMCITGFPDLLEPTASRPSNSDMANAPTCLAFVRLA